MQKTLYLILILALLAVSQGKTFTFGAKDNLNLDTHLFEDLISESNDVKALLSSNPKFINISDAFHKVEKFSMESLMELWGVHNAFQDLWITLSSVLEARFLMIDPERHDEAIGEKIEKFDKVLSDFKHSYFRIKEEIWRIPFSELFQNSEKNESSKIGIDNQTKLREKCEEFLDLTRHFRGFIEHLINDLEMKKIIIHESFSRNSYRKIRKTVLSNADFFLLHVTNKSQENCMDLSDCLQKIYLEFFQNKELDSTIPKPMLLWILLEELANVSSILADEKGDLINRALQHALNEFNRAKLVRKEKSWPLSIVRDWIVEKVFGLDDNHVKENFEREGRNLRAIFHLVQHDLKERYEKFIWNIWQEKQKEVVESFSS